MSPLGSAQPSLEHQRKQICLLRAQLSRAWGIKENKFVSFGPSSAEPGAPKETNLFPVGTIEPGTSKETNLFPMDSAQPSLGHHRRQICLLWTQLNRAWGILGHKFVSYGRSSAEPGASKETNLSPLGPSHSNPGASKETNLFPLGPAQPSLGHHRRQICLLWAQLNRAWGHQRKQICLLWAQLNRAWGIKGNKFVSFGPSSIEPGASKETNLFPLGPAQPSLGHQRRQICILWAQLSRAWGIKGDKFVSFGPSSAEPGASWETNLSPMDSAQQSLGHQRIQICLLWAQLIRAWGIKGDKFVSCGPSSKSWYCLEQTEEKLWPVATPFNLARTS